MQKKYTLLFLLGLFISHAASYAQMVGDNIYMQGHYLEVGLAPDGVLGATRNAPTGYHQHPGTSFSVYDPASCASSTQANLLASVYDFGHDGWTTGTPHYMGDYTLPGSPWEQWGVEVGGVNRYANFTMYETSCNGFSGASLSGSFTSYTNTAGVMRANWSGSAASGNLTINKEYRIDTEGSAMVITVKFVNTTASTLTGLYYFRACDPDNDETWPVSGSGFSTNNTVNYVSSTDPYHRAEVTAAAQSASHATIALGTKDCRAKALIFTSWGGFSYTTNISAIYAGTATAIGPSYYNGAHNGDIAIGLVYSLGDLAAYDSAIISYAYIYNGPLGIENAFPEPTLNANGTVVDSVDTMTVCSTSSFPISVVNGNDKDWSWSHWTWAPTTGLSSDTGVTNNLDVTALGGVTTTYTITGTDSAMGDCASKTFLLTVIPISSPPPTVSDTTYCQGVIPAPLTAGGTGLLWYTSATGGVGSPVPPVAVTTTLGTFQYYVSQTVSGCESPRAVINVTIQAPPVVTLSNNGPLCPGDNMLITISDTLTASGITYAWTGPGTFTSTVMNPTITGVVFADSGVYTVIVDNNGCFTLPTSTTVVVHSTPLPPTPNDVTYCQYYTGAVPLTATGSNILWYLTPTGGFGSPIAPTPSTLVAGTFTYYATQTINGCESPRQAVVVTINPQPLPPVIVDIPGTYCPGAPFIPFTISVGTGVLWYADSAGVGSATPPTLPTTTPGTFYYYATQTVLGCESHFAAFSYLVYPGVTSSFDTFVYRGCTSDSVSFNNTSTGTTAYLWLFGDGSSSSLANPTHVYTTQGVYTVTLYSHSTTCVDSSFATINLLHPVSANFTLSPAIVCQGLPASFRDTSIGTGLIYAWTFGDGNTSTLKDPTDIYLHTGTYPIHLTITDIYGCTSSDSSSITVDSISVMTMHITDSVLCLGDHITVESYFTSAGLIDLVWTFGDGDSVINVNPVVYAYPVTGSYTVTSTAHYRACPDAVASHPVSVFAQPTIGLGADTVICSGGESIVFTDNINAGNPAASWLWNTGQTTSSITVTEAGLYAATVTIGGCAATDSVNVTDDCILAMPNVFTPNGDGLNDYFNPRSYLSKGLNSFHMVIYNRWGQIVFKTDGLEGSGWDGMLNGTPQPEEVYIYTVTATFNDGQKLSKQGNLTLLR